jgi:hypothetical protein
VPARNRVRKRWVKTNPSLKGKALDDAPQSQPWDPAVTGYSYGGALLTFTAGIIIGGAA